MITVTKVLAQVKRTSRESDDKREDRHARMKQINEQSLSEALCTESTLSLILFTALQQPRWKTLESFAQGHQAYAAWLVRSLSDRTELGWAGECEGFPNIPMNSGL